ncbi:MAG: hypothetical protein J2P23_00150 [Microlunatus sp.]|nr:hypothetical protein [Microlunatus sp.]
MIMNEFGYIAVTRLRQAERQAPREATLGVIGRLRRLLPSGGAAGRDRDRGHLRRAAGTEPCSTVD